MPTKPAAPSQPDAVPAANATTPVDADGEITPELVARLEALAADARALLPFLKPLSDAVRQKSYKMGRKRLAFVEQALADARGADEILPRRVNVAGGEAHFERARALAPVRDLFAELASDLDDTVMADGTVAVGVGLEVKKAFQEAARHDAAYEDRAERLADLLRQADQAAKAAGRTPPHAADGAGAAATS